MSYEINYLLTVGIDGVEIFDDYAAGVARVAEWLDTPRGQIWGAPLWGHRLNQYKHYPVNGITATAIKNSILLTLPADVAGISINDISVIPTSGDMDSYTITIVVNNHVITKEVSL